jgi:phosphoribosylamine-glycine ligase
VTPIFNQSHITPNIGREHALAWKLQQSKHVARVFSFPGSIAIAQLAKTTIVGSDQMNLKDFAVNMFSIFAMHIFFSFIVIIVC